MPDVVTHIISLVLQGVVFPIFVLFVAKRIDDTTDWILMVDKETSELYEGHLDHHTGFLKKYTYIEGQPKKSR